jgi:cation:H+ antiporter
VDILILVFAFLIILLGAELFTNSIEWFGRKLNLAEGAVGSVLAAVGTALPETMIPIIAILFATGESSNEVGVGAILGAPFMLATLAMFVTGTAVLLVRNRRPAGDTMLVDTRVLSHDMGYFAVAYAIAIGAAFLPLEPVWLKWIVAVVLLGIYAWYVKGHFEADASVDLEDLTPLRFHRLDRTAHREDPAEPRLRIVNLQVVAALGLIILGAVFFVDAVEHLASQFGVDELLLALVIAPIATELPEKFNSVLWVRQGKDTLAMGNITGAMVFQSTIPTVVALVFASSSWVIGPGSYIAFASAGIAFLSSAFIFLPMARSGRLLGRGLLVGGVFYVAYLILVGLVVTGTIGGVEPAH